MEFSISTKMMSIHFSHFDQSLKCFPDKYHSLFFTNKGVIPQHFGYVCPICVTNCFMVDRDGLHYTSDFSLDHFPPESSGGKLKILVCKKCNSEAGHLYDFSLKKKLEYISFNKKIPLSTLTAKSEITDVQGWYHSAMSIREDGETEISFKPNLKKKFPLLDNWIEESKNSFDWKANLTFGIPDDKKVSKALLKAAYLYCFLNFGYEFIYSSNGEFFRKVLNGEVEYPITVPTFWLDHETKIHKDLALPVGLCFIQKPHNWQSLIINLSLTLKDTGYKCTVPILIPNPTDTDFKQLIEVQKQIENNQEQEVSFVPLKNFLRENIYDSYSLALRLS
jgi:hypothetical protein